MSTFDPNAADLLGPAFFVRPTEVVARELLGKIITSAVSGRLCGGAIVETEAYLGSHDPGSHASTRGVTERNRVMYGPPGRLYVYFTYGNHHMLNLVSEPEGTAGAVLIRAIEPLVGVDAMEARRGGRTGAEVANGPGKVAQALGLTRAHNGMPLGGPVRVYDAPPLAHLGRSGRVGLSSGHELPLRFYVVGSAYVSKGRTGPKPPSGAVASEKGRG